ncbi:MAG: HAD family hydrolase [Nocardioides sp.]
MYTGPIILATGVLLVVFMAYLVHRLVAVSKDPLFVLPYQSGWQPNEHALSTQLVTLSNGSTSVAEALFDRAGIRGYFHALLSVEDAPLWKPAAAAYAYALKRCEVEPSDAMLVAGPPWDIDGAARAGLAAAWLNRGGGHYPDHFQAPDLTVESLTALADELSGRTRPRQVLDGATEVRREPRAR